MTTVDQVIDIIMSIALILMLWGVSIWIRGRKKGDKDAKQIVQLR